MITAIANGRPASSPTLQTFGEGFGTLIRRNDHEP